MAEQFITSLAILKVNWDKGRDYIDILLPFVVEALRTMSHPEISLPDLQKAVAEDFSLQMPQGVLATLLDRVGRLGYVKRVAGVWCRDEAILPNVTLAAMKGDALRQHEALVLKLVAYCKEKHAVTLSRDEAGTALDTYLRDRCAIVLSNVLACTPVALPARRSKSHGYLISSFIADVSMNDPDGFGFLETVAKGSMLAGVLCYPDFGSVEQRLDQLSVYMDTPLLLRALGLDGKEMQTPCIELLDLLHDLKANIRCFNHSFDELQGVLRAAEGELRRPLGPSTTRGQVLQYCIDKGLTPSDVELMIAGLVEHLKRLHVEVVSTPPYRLDLGIDENGLSEILQHDVRYRWTTTRDRDVRSLSAIHRLREGQVSQSLENSVAVFVTTNPLLVAAGRHFFLDEYGELPVPLCILYHVLTTIAWLKKPMKAPNLPANLLIAQCYAGMNPPNDLWNLYLKEIGKLRETGDVSPNEYNLLRFSSGTRHLLMATTLGEVGASVEGSIQDVIERARKEMTAGLEQALETETEKRLAAETEAERTRKQMEEEHRAREARKERLAVRITEIMGALLLVLGAVFLVWAFAPESWLGALNLQSVPWGLKWLRPVAGFAVSVLTSLLGGSLLDAVAKLKQLVARRIVRLLQHLP